MNNQFLLQGLHREVDPQRLLPAEAAVQIFLPLARANDPKRAETVEMFRQWVLDRGQAVSLNHVAYLWTNFRQHFAKEAGTRWQAWSHSASVCGLASPTELAKFEGRIFFMTVFKPWLDTMRRTRMGRLVANAVLGLGAALVLSVVFVISWVAGAAGTEVLAWLLQLLH